MRTARIVYGWNLALWSEQCTGMLKLAGLNPSSGTGLTFRSALLLTVRDSYTRAPIVVDCLLCYPDTFLFFKMWWLKRSKGRLETINTMFVEKQLNTCKLNGPILRLTYH
jgi:hypothetical protein